MPYNILVFCGIMQAGYCGNSLCSFWGKRMGILNHKFGLSNSASQFLETRISLESIVTVQEYFGTIYGLDIDENYCEQG